MSPITYFISFSLFSFCRMSLYPSLEDLKVDKVMRVIHLLNLFIFFNDKFKHCNTVIIFYVNEYLLWQAQAQFAQSTSSAPAITEGTCQPTIQSMPSSSKSVTPAFFFFNPRQMYSDSSWMHACHFCSPSPFFFLSCAWNLVVETIWGGINWKPWNYSGCVIMD